jgi:alkaline phosphatase D
MNIEYGLNPDFLDYSHKYIDVDLRTDYVGHYKLDKLVPNSAYFYKVWFSDPRNSSVVSQVHFGKFMTAPLPNTEESISFAIGGDLGGQEFCRKDGIGYHIFSVIKGFEPDFFVANGDLIYADDTCSEGGPKDVQGWKNIPMTSPSILDYSVNWDNMSEVYSIYKIHWEYNKSDKHYQFLLANVPVYSLSDDHEVADNYNGRSDVYNEAYENRSGYKNLVHAGLEAFFRYSPVESIKEDPQRIYRSFNWGSHLDLFLLDSHQYRTSGITDQTVSTNNTLLGKPQLEWLKYSLKNSNATWKIILNDVPVTIPHCLPEKLSKEGICDNWATDNKTAATFTRERQDFLRYLDQINLKNVIFMTTDVHFPSIVVVDQDFDGDGEALKFYEFTSGPLSAGLQNPEPLDPTINATYLYNEGGFFNFGYHEIKKFPDHKIHFTSQVITADGLSRSNSMLDLVAE